VRDIENKVKGEEGRTDLLVSLENVQPPPDEGLAGLRRLVVLQQRTRSVRIPRRIRRCCEQTRYGEVGLPLVFDRRRRGG
jgi:hypothetical protein